MRVCHVDFPVVYLYGTLMEDVQKGYPALLKVESKPESNKYSVIAYRAIRLRQRTKEDAMIMAIDKMEKAAW